MNDEKNLAIGGGLLALLVVGALLVGPYVEPPHAVQPAKPPANPIVVPTPTPAPIPTPIPEPPPRPCPGPGPCPRAAGDAGCQPVGLGNGEVGAIEAVVDGENHNGVEVQLPLPPDFHTKNVGGSDGAGLCVFDSMHHSGIWCNEPVFSAIFDWMKKHPGGGYPEKVTKMVKQCAKELGLPEPDYIQVTGKDLEILKTACRLGRMPGVTYNHSPTGRYNGMRISHMVNLVHADDNWFVVLDNNYVTGEKHLEWMSPSEFSKVYGAGWAVIPLKAGPPYGPSNALSAIQ